MDEGRRFLRYVAPGLLFAVESGILVAARGYTDIVGVAVALLRDAGFGAFATLFILSGGLGYLFSLTHHVLHWCVWIPSGFARSAKPSVSAAIARGHLILLDEHGEPLDNTHSLSHHQAWQILVALWHERVESVDRMKGADTRATSLGDIMHNAGTALIGFAAAVIVALAGGADGNGLLPTSAAFWLITALLSIIHVVSFAATSRMSQGVVDIILADALRAELLTGVAHAIVPTADAKKAGATGLRSIIGRITKR